MPHDHEAARLHRQDLEREIEALRTERQLAAESGQPGLVDRARRMTGHALIAAGRAVAGSEARPLRIHQA